MAVESIVETDIETYDNIEFPCLMQNKYNKTLIVFFVGRLTGISVGPENLGRFSQTWDISRFEKFNGSVTLKNS